MISQRCPFSSGVSSTFLFVCPLSVRNSFSNFRSLSVFACVFLFSCSVIKSSIELSKGWNHSAIVNVVQSSKVVTESDVWFALSSFLIDETIFARAKNKSCKDDSNDIFKLGFKQAFS